MDITEKIEDPNKKNERQERTNEALEEHRRPGGGNWGDHNQEEDGRKFQIPVTRGGANVHRYEPLIEED